MVWYCEKCRSYHQDGMWCPNAGLLDPIIDFTSGFYKGYREADDEFKTWKRDFDNDMDEFWARQRKYDDMILAAQMQAAEQERRQEEHERQKELLRMKIELEREKQKAGYKTNSTSIPPQQQHREEDPYSILGISRNASRNEIERAFRSLSKEWHPDKFAYIKDDRVQKMAHEKYIKIKNAYEQLMENYR